MMLFACGVGVGLFFYGVGEPIYHYTGRNRYSADPSLPDNELAQIAINLPMYHWGKYHLYLMLILYVFFDKGEVAIYSYFNITLIYFRSTWLGNFLNCRLGS